MASENRWKEHYCKGCGVWVEHNFAWCPDCKRKKLHLTKLCPKCGVNLVTKRAKQCRACRYSTTAHGKEDQ